MNSVKRIHFFSCTKQPLSNEQLAALVGENVCLLASKFSIIFCLGSFIIHLFANHAAP